MSFYKRHQKFIFILAVLALIAIAGQVLAQDVVKLPNPLGRAEVNENFLLDWLGKVAEKFISIVGAIALLMFIYGGFMWLTSGGEPDKIKKGKDVVIWSVVGLAIIFSSYLLVSIILQPLSFTENCKELADKNFTECASPEKSGTNKNEDCGNDKQTAYKACGIKE